MSNLLWIPATSPLFAYYPSPVYFSGFNFTASWLGVSDASLSPPNNTYKTTTGSSSFILPSIYATSFTPIWDETSMWKAALGVGSSQMTEWTSGQDATSQGSPNQQSYLVEVQCSTSDCSADPFKFRGAWLTADVASSGSSLLNVTLDDASPYVEYSGFTPLYPQPPSVGTNIQANSTDNNSTLSATKTPGASASVQFLGTSILVSGLSDPSLGSYTVTLDGTNTTLNAGDNVTTHANILFFASNLAANQIHNLVLTCEDGGLVLDNWIAVGPPGQVGFIGSVGGATTTIGPSTGGTSTSQPSSSVSSTSGTAAGSNSNAGRIAGGILGTVAGLAVLYYLFRKCAMMKPHVKKKLNPWDEANLLQNMKNEEVHVTTAANQRYVYPGLIAHSELRR